MHRSFRMITISLVSYGYRVPWATATRRRALSSLTALSNRATGKLNTSCANAWRSPSWLSVVCLLCSFVLLRYAICVMIQDSQNWLLRGTVCLEHRPFSDISGESALPCIGTQVGVIFCSWLSTGRKPWYVRVEVLRSVWCFAPWLSTSLRHMKRRLRRGLQVSVPSHMTREGRLSSSFVRFGHPPDAFSVYK